MILFSKSDKLVCSIICALFHNIQVLLKKIVHENIPLQISVLYATQVFCNDQEFPKGILQFHSCCLMFYDYGHQVLCCGSFLTCMRWMLLRLRFSYNGEKILYRYILERAKLCFKLVNLSCQFMWISRVYAVPFSSLRVTRMNFYDWQW